jgi:hypothetical protein
VFPVGLAAQQREIECRDVHETHVVTRSACRVAIAAGERMQQVTLRVVGVALQEEDASRHVRRRSSLFRL